MRASKVLPTSESLKSVNVTLLDSARDTLTLYCEGCGNVYRVTRQAAEAGRLNWYACPGLKHQVQQ